MQNKLLYESTHVWDQSLQLGQKNLTQAIIDFFPKEINSALDIGCGDGKLTSTLIEVTKCPFVGLDTSQEALSRCSFHTIQADATDLPFQENAFDLVLTTDMLEHLPRDMEDKVWEQLFRVSNKWVMVAVPFREELLEATAKCHECGTPYHVNWHMRSYDWPELISRCPDSYVVDKIVLTGEPWSAHPILETRFRREIMNEWGGWTEAVCPHCNKPGTSPDPLKPLPSIVATSLGELIYTERLNIPEFRNHSEILIIYRNKELAAENTVEFNSINRIRVKANTIDFEHASIEDNLIPYPSLTRVVNSIEHGIIIQFPAYFANDIWR